MNLPLQQSIVLDHRYWLGSFRDFSRYGNHGVPTGLHFEKRPDTHARFSGSDKITVADSPELQGTEFTLIAYGEFDKYNSGDRLISKRDGGGTNYDVFFNTDTQITIYDGSVSSAAAINWKGSNFVSLSIASGEKFKGYVNGVYVDEGSAVSTITADDAPLIVGNIYFGSSNVLSNPLKGALIYNTVLTEAQVAKAYEWTLEAKSPTYKKRNFFVPSQLTGREDGLVAGYSFENVGQKTINVKV